MSHKILILLLYYNRPQLVRNALKSILRSTYDNWQVAFIDDSSPLAGRPVVEEVFGDRIDRVKFYNPNMTVEEKRNSGGVLGDLLNQAIRDSDADVGIMLCDDDELVPDYLGNLDRFFTKRPRAQSCYCHVHEFIPGVEDTLYVDNTVSRFNKYTAPINPARRVDASQVAWRLSVNKDRGVWFPTGITKNLDSYFFDALRHGAGRVRFAGIVGQYKGISGTALINFSTEEVWAGKDIDAEAAAKTVSQDEYGSLVDRYLERGLTSEAYRIMSIAFRIYGVWVRDTPALRGERARLLRNQIDRLVKGDKQGI